MPSARRKGGVVGRFQVMAVLQAARARALGLALDEAKSWGLNRAIFYAAAKRGFRSRRNEGPDAETRRRRFEASETYCLGDEKAYAARGESLRFQMGDRIQTPRDFDRQIRARFGDWEGAWREATRIIMRADLRVLKSQRRFFDAVYKPRRDELAAKWSAVGGARRAA